MRDLVPELETAPPMDLAALLRARDVTWASALLPEGPEVIQRVTARFLELRRGT